MPKQEKSTSIPAHTLQYGPNDKPPLITSLIVALQFISASLATIIAPPLIIADGLGLSNADASFLISTSLFCAGISTFIQTKRIGKIGTGLLVIEGANITFVGVIIAAGIKFIAKEQGQGIEIAVAQSHALGMIFCGLLAASLIVVGLSFLIKYCQKLLPPIVLGVIVSLVGLCLIKVGAIACGGGEQALIAGTFGQARMLIVSASVIFITILCQFSKIRLFSMVSVLWGFIGGTILAFCFDLIPTADYSGIQAMNIPRPFAYGFGFEWGFFLNMTLLSTLLMISTAGIITSSCVASEEAVVGENFIKRMSGGVLGQTVNSCIAAVFSCIPQTPYAVINGLIPLSGIASRRIGYIASVMLVVAGIFPVVAQTFILIPQPVLGGASLLLFGSIAVSGIQILLNQPLDNRSTLIIGISFAIGLSVELYPLLLSKLPELLRDVCSSGITVGSFTAVILNVCLPKK